MSSWKCRFNWPPALWVKSICWQPLGLAGSRWSSLVFAGLHWHEHRLSGTLTYELQLLTHLRNDCGRIVLWSFFFFRMCVWAHGRSRAGKTAKVERMKIYPEDCLCGVRRRRGSVLQPERPEFSKPAKVCLYGSAVVLTSVQVRVTVCAQPSLRHLFTINI